jgi:membrane-bound lytic murein transglycosylase B
MIPVTFRNIRNIGTPETRISRRKRAAAAGMGVLMTSALALPVGMVAASAGDSHLDGAGAASAAKAHPSISGRLQAVLATLGPLGATGALPRNSAPSPALADHARSLAKSAASAGRGGLAPGPLGIPGTVLQAYRRAQQIMAAQQPSCHLPWWLLAGIGEVESRQADGGLVDAQGNTLTLILGPVLDGANGTAALPASGGGWQRAIGPMQFLPSTWSTWGGGGNPNNVYDAALAAGRYLCAGGWNLSDPAQQAMAVFTYNHSDSYVQLVLTWAYAYAGGVYPLPMMPLPPGGPNPVPTGGPNPVTQPSPARPSHRPRSAGSAARSSSSAQPTTSSPPHPRSSSPTSPPSTPGTTPKPTPTPLPSLPLPIPLPSLPLPIPLPSLP